MSVKVKCPACRDAVFAAEADRGTNIKCGTCWADVPVPKADEVTGSGSGPVPPPAPVAKPLTAPPVAKALPQGVVVPAVAGPAPAPAPKAQPLPPAEKPPVATALPLPTPAAPAPAPAAKPATLNPVGSKSSDRDDDRQKDKKKEKPRFKERDEDDEDDDRPRRSNENGSGGGKGVLIAFIAIGLFLAVGLVGGIVLLLRGNGDTDTADTTPADNGNAVAANNGNPRNPGGDFNPNAGFNKPPAQANGWQVYDGKGFAMLSPGAVKAEKHTFPYGGQFITGMIHKGGDDTYKVEAVVVPVADPEKVSNPGFLAAAFQIPLPDRVKKGNGRILNNNNAGVEFTVNELDGSPGAMLSATTGPNAYLFHIRWKANTVDGPRRRDEFFDAVRVGGGGGDDVANPDVAAGRPNPLQPRPPRNPLDPFGANDPERIATAWKEVANKGGFVAEAPVGVKGEKHILDLDRGTLLNGMKYHADDGRCEYWMYYHDLAAGQEMDLQKIAGKLVHAVFPHEVKGSEDGKVDGKAATKWKIRHFHGGMSSGYSVQVGYRVFTFFVTNKAGIYNGHDATLEERQAKFLGSLRLPFDPKTANPYDGEADWVPMARTVGFTVSVPKQATREEEFRPFFGFDVPVGKRYVAEVDGIVYEANAIELNANKKKPTDPDKTLFEVVKWFTDREKLLESAKAKLSGLDADQYTFQTGERTSLLRVVQVGRAAFALKTTPTWDKKAGDKEFADKSAKFFDSFRAGNAAAGGGGGAAANVPLSAAEFAQPVPGKVKAFWACVILAEKNELLTVGVRDPLANPPGGVLRRYSFPECKLKATYHLAQPAHRAVADERGGKLYLASVSAAVDARMPEREAAIVGGAVQVFDLKKLTDDSVGELETVKPLATHSVGSAKVSGLEVSATGETVFVSCVVVGGTKLAPTYSGKLMRLDAATGKAGTDMLFTAPVWAMKLSPDGKRLAVVERATDATGSPRGSGNLVSVDATNWRQMRATPLTGIPHDAVYLGDRPAALLGTTSNTAKLTVVEADGDSTDVDLPSDAKYAVATKDGRRVLASIGVGGNALTLYEVSGDKPTKLTKKAAGSDGLNQTIGGLLTLSPDGKWAVLNTGAVIDLDKSGPK